MWYFPTAKFIKQWIECFSMLNIVVNPYLLTHARINSCLFKLWPGHFRHNLNSALIIFTARPSILNVKPHSEHAQYPHNPDCTNSQFAFDVPMLCPNDPVCVLGRPVIRRWRLHQRKWDGSCISRKLREFGGLYTHLYTERTATAGSCVLSNQTIIKWFMTR